MIKIFFSLFLSTFLISQSPAFTTFGLNNACAFGPGQVYPLNLPRIAQPFTYNVYSSGPVVTGSSIIYKTLLFGFSNIRWQQHYLPLSSLAIQSIYPNILSCGALLVSIDYSYVIPISFPQASISNTYLIPNQPSLVGMDFFQQIVSFGHSNGYSNIEFGVGNWYTIGI